MKVSSFFVSLMGAIQWVALFGWAGCARAQAPTNQASLARQSSIVFSGTVSKIGATSFADVPKSAQTLVVRVDFIVKKPSAVSLKKGDDVTVEVKDPSVFQEGTHATFYTDGWIFGSGVAVKELGHEIGPGVGGTTKAAGADEKAHGQGQEQISDQELRDRLNSADFVVIGRVTDIHRWNVPKSAYRVTEHDPDWHEAVVEVQSVLKGGKVKGNKVVVRFPQRNDVAWVHSPKFEKNQQGIFCLNRDQVSGVPMTKLGGHEVNVYTCLGHGDSLPMSEEARVRSFLKAQ
ncbi:MAG: hypothetical protein AUH86_10035 [Acidobacteria bacterium 13_1_40CM_4_58_4]|nr:MAG: hypothetical protein AUH86_10035 [Acidobacteria bacterium 13_1_40CM_4_58_4]OLE57198.1 MAG: hypothetical protein AUG13_05140 [Chloroflexi bacterium 13_1_20CM_2_59_7]